MATYPNLDFQNFYETTLSNDLAIGATDVFLTVVPTPTEGFLTIDPEGANPEIIWYSSKTSSKVVCPALGRGFDGTSAQAWTSGTKVIMAPVAETQRQINDAASALTTTVTQGWITPSQTVGAVAYNGNRSYTLTMSADVSATLSPGMRVRTTRTVTAPTQCTSLNGTSHYWSRASASLTGMTFTNNFTCSAWIKISGYVGGTILNRLDASINNGFRLGVNSSGQIELLGINTSNANNRSFISQQSIPLNKWVHVASSWATGVGKIYIDGIDVPIATTTAGTAPTTITQAGDFAVGRNGASAANFFNGKIAQAAVFNAVLTQATIQGYISQGLSGTETSLVSAWSFNGTANDLNTTNANNLTAQASVTATDADSPFSTNSFGTETGTTDYGIITRVVTTALTVQVPEGCTIPTSGGVSAIAYSTQKAPYGMPTQNNRWQINWYISTNTGLNLTSGTWSSGTTNGTLAFTIPIGEWNVGYNVTRYADKATAINIILDTTLSTSNSTESDRTWTSTSRSGTGSGSTIFGANMSRNGNLSLSAQTTYYLVGRATASDGGSLNAHQINGIGSGSSVMVAESAYL